MEMNRYLIAALYVMAGCVVTIPLKVQGSPETFKGERCRLVITNTVKIVSTYLDNRDVDQTPCDLSFHYDYSPWLCKCKIRFSFDRLWQIKPAILCYVSHKIRAPGDR